MTGLRFDPAREAEIVEELTQHLDDRCEELRAAGTSDADARRLAIEELSEAGGLTSRLQTLSQAHARAPVVHGQPAAGLMRGFWQDMRYAVRAVKKESGFAATIVLTLALGIAVNTTVFTIVNAAVLRPLPFDDADRIVRLGVTNVGNAQNTGSDLSYLDLQDWQMARRTFEHIAAVAQRGVNVSGDDRPAARVDGAYVSWNSFSMLGQQPVLGRDFTEADDQAGASPVVILGGNLWRARYGADPAILGTTIRVAGVPSTVVGVMPREFGFPDRQELWLPLVALPQSERTSRSARGLDTLGRLRAGVTIDEATAELSGITAALAERYPDTNRDIVPRVWSAGIASQFVAVMIALLGAVGFVLLIACANVANLLLARAVDRSRDVTLRLALGASRWRIVRQLLVESLLLATAGGVCGLALSYPALELVQNLPAESAPPYWVQFTMDGVVVAYLVALCVGSALVCGLVPAWHASRTNLAASMNDTGRGSAGSRWRRRWTSAFVVAQVAASLILLTGATMMMQNLSSLTRMNVGIDTSGLMQMAFDFRTDETPDRRLLFFAQLEERLASSAHVNAALASDGPMGGAPVRRLRIDGRPAADTETLPLVLLVRIGQGYFDAVGAPVIAGPATATGRVRLSDDRVMVNERFVRMHFRDEPVIGRRILLIEPNASADASATARWMTIDGVVGNVLQSGMTEGQFDPVVYGSYAADPPERMLVRARSASGPAAAAAFVSDQMRALNPDVPLFGASTVDEALARRRWPQRIFGSMFAVFASIALLLATCGLYAVTAYAVSRRTREIGVRVALGADARRVWWAVMGATVRQLAIGLVLGTIGAAAVATVLPAILVGTGGGSLLAFAGVAAVLVAAGVAAGTIPARRAMRIDPMTALQTE